MGISMTDSISGADFGANFSGWAPIWWYCGVAARGVVDNPACYFGSNDFFYGGLRKIPCRLLAKRLREAIAEGDAAKAAVWLENEHTGHTLDVELLAEFATFLETCWGFDADQPFADCHDALDEAA